MTIIVAMYGKPLVASAVAAAPPGSQPAEPVAAAARPVNTDTLTASSGPVATSRLSGAQLAFANLPFGSIATGLFTLVMLAAIGLWITKHAFAVRRVFASGEAFMIRHPLLDVGLLIVAALSLLLTRTAGLVG